MPVSGEPTPFPITLLIPRPNETVRQAVCELSRHFPKPYNYNSWVGFNFRKRRLGVELAEFDLLHRLRHGSPADCELLCRAGEAIIAPLKNGFPTDSLPLDGPLFVNTTSFDKLMRVIASEREPVDERIDLIVATGAREGGFGPDPRQADGPPVP